MRILLIDNHTKHLSDLKQSLAVHDIEIQQYHPGLNFNHHGKDLVVLSGGGGEGLEMHDTFRPGRLWYEDQIKFVQQCELPMLGICMGFEVMAAAHGSQIESANELVQGYKQLSLFGADKPIEQFESHNYRVSKIDHNQFDVRAKSSIGIEMIVHKDRALVATQFHPEKGGTLNLSAVPGHLSRLSLDVKVTEVYT